MQLADRVLATKPREGAAARLTGLASRLRVAKSVYLIQLLFVRCWRSGY
jgi:hypothetical protein